VCVCVCVCVCVYLCLDLSLCMYTQVRTCIFALRVLLCACVYACLSVCMTALPSGYSGSNMSTNNSSRDLNGRSVIVCIALL